MGNVAGRLHLDAVFFRGAGVKQGRILFVLHNEHCRAIPIEDRRKSRLVGMKMSWGCCGKAGAAVGTHGENQLQSRADGCIARRTRAIPAVKEDRPALN